MITPDNWPDSWLCADCGAPRLNHVGTIWCSTEQNGDTFRRKTMPFAGMMRIKNESAWIERVVRAMLPLCEHVFILDDHSTDNTVEICRSFGDRVTVYESGFTDLDESRDKNALLDLILPHGPEVIACFDGDEVLRDGGADLIRESVAAGGNAWSLRILYLWNRDDQVRVDGVYRNFARPSLFRVINPAFRFMSTPWGGNLHCSSIPQELIHGFLACPAALLHLGYRDRDRRIQKFDWYNTVDPLNEVEEFYWHVIQGDVPTIPASAVLKWAGPLTLVPLADV